MLVVVVVQQVPEEPLELVVLVVVVMVQLGAVRLQAEPQILVVVVALLNQAQGVQAALAS
jgi:hypothetical protein